MSKKLLFVLLLLVILPNIRASHVMGGEITYTCIGNNTFIFELVFYRDCNGAEVNVVAEDIKVWNHPTLQNISLPFLTRVDISPLCTLVPGGPPPFDCGSGSAAGNGIGAIEKVIYKSSPIQINGTPPAQGWIFTYENFSRSGAITNMVNPSSYGITLTAKMYAIPGFNGSGCSDSSPRFLQEPNFVSCAASPYVYNMNAVDPDLDSLSFSLGIPFNHFPGATAYNPPTSPIPVPFETGFSYTNPTPSNTINPLNIGATVNSNNGELSFTSYTTGTYVVKICVKSFRSGVLISEVEREMQLIVNGCTQANNAPLINPPFSGGSYDISVTAGTLVNFNLNAVDDDLLQDGNPQNLVLIASGPMFGNGFNTNTGCAIEPCAQLNSTLPVISPQNVTANFSWQTDCNHLVNQYGNEADVVPYNFVFRVQDDFCQVPKVSYATVTINVVNPGVLPPTSISCIQTALNGDLTINWNSSINPTNTFSSYRLRSLQGLDITIPDISTTSYTIPAVNAAHDFYIGVQSGCNGNVVKYADTLKNIHLVLTNPGNGTAILQWNTPSIAQGPNMNNFVHIYREYPINNFELIDSVPYTTMQYKDTIDICSDVIGYHLVLPNSPCPYTSNHAYDTFEDMITPDIPIILSAGADTTQDGNVLITWNQNGQPDTYGYVIYTFDQNGFLYELDTVWGWQNTSYSYTENLTNGPFTYSVAAFDSCTTNSFPITFQTSAKASLNVTMLLTEQIQMCEKIINFSWTPYVGRIVDNYILWKKQNDSWENILSTTETSATVDVENGESYCFFVEAKFNDGFGAFSSPSCFVVPSPGQPSYHYFKLATVEGDNVVLTNYIDASVGVQSIVFERRQAAGGAFEFLATVPVTNNFTTFTDDTKLVNETSLEYQTKYIDSCGFFSATYANINRTIHATGISNEYDLINSIQWNRYEGFNAGVSHYLVYRSLNGSFSEAPIASIPNSDNNQEIFSYTDAVDSLISNTESADISEYTNGAMCYRIVAVENTGNIYGFQDSSRSNDVCLNYKPLVFIPNAFTPGGLNPIFIPVITNVSELNYSFQILNRWGDSFFQTNSILEGWDGKIAATGRDASNDTYIYRIIYEDQNGNTHTKKGTVSLVR